MAQKTLKIPPVLNGEYEYVAPERLKVHPRNSRSGDRGAIFQSIQENGFFGACVVQKSTSHILVGNHRYLASLDAGLPAIPVIWADVSDDQALRILLADNKTSDDANYNESALAELLTELAGTERGLAGTAFSGDDLDQLISDLAGMPQPAGSVNDPNAEWDGMPEFVHEDKTAFQTIALHLKDTAAVEAFAELIGQKITPQTRYAWYPEIEIEHYADKRYASES